PCVQQSTRDGQQPHPQPDERKVQQEQDRVANIQAGDEPPDQSWFMLKKQRTWLKAVLLKRSEQDGAGCPRRKPQRQQRNERAGSRRVVRRFRAGNAFNGPVTEL